MALKFNIKTAIVVKMVCVFLCVLLFSGFLNMNIATVDGGNIVGILSQDGDEEAIDVAVFLSGLPPHLQSHSHQAGGHHFTKKQDSIGMLENIRDGLLLKPVNPKSIKELNFYKEIENGYHPNLAQLIPAYHGVIGVPYKAKSKVRGYRNLGGSAKPKAVDFIQLEDLTYGFRKPCVIDLKIGEETWDLDATDVKINHEKTKNPELKKKYGFAMPGYLVRNPVTNKKTKFDREICRLLKPESLVKAIEDFVNTTGNNQATAALVRNIIEKVQRIVEWASTQTELRLRASSILILYDSQELLDRIPAIVKDPDIELNFVRVKVVDFAHAYKAPEDDPGIDTNYLRGARSVLKIFRDILKKYSNLK